MEVDNEKFVRKKNKINNNFLREKNSLNFSVTNLWISGKINECDVFVYFHLFVIFQ